MQSPHLSIEAITQQFAIVTDTLHDVARAYFFMGRLGDAQDVLRASLQLAEAGEAQDQNRLKLLLLYANVLIVHHVTTHADPTPMFSIIAEAKQIAESIQSQQGIADALGLLGQAHYFATVTANIASVVASLKEGAVLDNVVREKFAIALDYQQQALEQRIAMNDTRGMSESHFQIGTVYERWQEYDTALEHYTTARQIADTYNHLLEKVEPTRHLALNALQSGDLEAALTYALQARALREQVSFKPYQPLDHLLLRDIYLAKGDTTNAQLQTQQAIALAEAMGIEESLAPLLNE